MARSGKGGGGGRGSRSSTAGNRSPQRLPAGRGAFGGGTVSSGAAPF